MRGAEDSVVLCISSPLCELCHRLQLWGGWEAPAGQVSLSSHNFVGVWLLTGMRTWVRVVLLGCGNKKKEKEEVGSVRGLLP